MDKYKLKKSSIIHKLIENDLYNFVIPYTKLIDIRYFIEKKIEEYGNKYNAKIAFPVGLSLNNCAAHFSPFRESTIEYTDKDILKIDYGIHIDGNIIDSAFSITHNYELKKLKDISLEATNGALKLAGIDSHLGDMGELIEEIITSYEIEIQGKIYNINCCRDLCGHQILPYKIHGNKVVPNIKISYNERMLENEVYAIETFPTTGKGILISDKENNSHYMIDYNSNFLFKNSIVNDVYNKFNTLAWHIEWLDIQKNSIDKNKYINSYPPLYDINNSYIAQTEKTVYIGEKKIIF